MFGKMVKYSNGSKGELARFNNTITIIIFWQNNVSVHVQFTISKTGLDFSNNFVYKLPHELPNNFTSDLGS